MFKIKNGTGGMQSKIEAATIAKSAQYEKRSSTFERFNFILMLNGPSISQNKENAISLSNKDIVT